MRAQFASLARRGWFPPALIALLAFIVVVSTIDPAGDYPNAPQGPGLTVDEFFNVQEGVRLVEGWKAFALGAISLRDLYGDQRMLGNQAPPIGFHLADHPPLGRIWLGVFHNLTKAIAPPGDHPSFFVTACARVGSAAAFALTVFLVGYAATKWYGAQAGIVAALSLCLMPRVFGHAHLAALETSMNLTYLAAVLAVASRWPDTWSAGGRGPSWQMAAVTGAFLGLALLTKIQGILIPIPIAIWALAHWRWKAIRPLIIWGGAGLAVFFIGWPWLWFDPVSHFLQYVGRTANRTELNVWYLGQRFADRDVPWHYVPVMFLVTIPVGLHILGLFGLQSGARPAWKEPREQVLLGAMLFPMVLFSLPGIVVYDSERLFLVSFPLWAILIGRGGAAIWKWIEERTSRATAIIPVLFVLVPLSVQLYRAAPCYLSFYEKSLPGLNTRSLERNYWGDAITRSFLEEVVQKIPEGSKVHFAPVLHPIQLTDLPEQSPILRRHRIELVPFDSTKTADVRYVMFFHRLADLPDVLRDIEPGRIPLAEVHSGTTPVASLYEGSAIRPAEAASTAK